MAISTLKRKETWQNGILNTENKKQTNIKFKA